MNGQIGLTSAQTYHYFGHSQDMSDVRNRGTCLKELLAVNPEAEVVIGPAPAGPDGKSGTEGWGKVGTLTCLTTNAANDPRKVDAFLAMLDAYYSDPEYMELVSYGIEGITFTKDGDERKRLGEMSDLDLRKEGIYQVDFGDTVTFMQNIKPAQTKFAEEVTGNGYYRFNVPAVAEFSNVIANLDTLTEQAYFAIITGEKPIDYFDTYVEEFKAAGGEAAEKAVQEAYAEKLAAVKIDR